MPNDTSKPTVENRASFFARLEPVLPPADMLRVKLAYILTKEGHRYQVRSEKGPDGRPLRYFEHPRRVALILIDEAGIVEADLVCAALLHDTWEDTRDLGPEMLEQFWGHEVCRIVMTVSKRPRAGYEKRLARADWKALAIKLVDRLDNLRSMGLGQVTPEFRTRKLTETCDHYLPLFDRLLEIAPVEHRKSLAVLVAQVRQLATE